MAAETRQRAEAMIWRMLSAIPPNGRAPADVLPADGGPLDPAKHTAAALAVQQMTLLRLSAGVADDPEWSASVRLAERMVAAHQLGAAVARNHGPKASLAERLAAVEGTAPMPAEILPLLADVQSSVQDALNEATRRHERQKQDKLVEEGVSRRLRASGAEPTEQALDRLGTLERNEIVQGVFLHADASIDRFLAATESATGNLNDYENLGKFAYTVATLGSILLTPDHGILSVATRPDVLQALIGRRTSTDDAADTPVILRFPIRAEYLGKFDSGFADGVLLLEDTTVSPDDVELLVHREWVRATNEAFLATLREMFGDRPAR